MPCVECSKLIIQAGIVRVVYERPYRVTDGVELLKRAGIQVDNIPSEEIEMNIMWDEEFVRQNQEICANCGYDNCNGNDPNCPKLKKK
jgi:deoxycytidylate deaminase